MNRAHTLYTSIVILITFRTMIKAFSFWFGFIWNLPHSFLLERIVWRIISNVFSSRDKKSLRTHQSTRQFKPCLPPHSPLFNVVYLTYKNVTKSLKLCWIGYFDDITQTFWFYAKPISSEIFMTRAVTPESHFHSICTKFRSFTRKAVCATALNGSIYLANK